MPVGNPGGRDEASGRFATNSANLQNWADNSRISQVDAAVILVGVRSVTDAAKDLPFQHVRMAVRSPDED